MLRSLILIPLLGLLFTPVDSNEPGRPVVKAISHPGGEGAHLPNLALGADGRLYHTWVEPREGGVTELLFSVMEEDGWSKPRPISRGSDWFVNWADFPAIAALEDGTLLAHWLGRIDVGVYAYGVRMSLSTDGGKTWGEPFSPHSDRSPTEHGFVSIVPRGEHFEVVWLDGREMTGGHGHGGGHGGELDGAEEPGAMAIRTARVSRTGEVTGERVLDDRTCECCQTAAVILGEKLIVAFRDRSKSEVRDISFVEVPPGGEAPHSRVLHADGWNQEGCPVNGPSLAIRSGDGPEARSELGAVWYTEAEGRPRVLFSRAKEDLSRFSPPSVLDGGNPVGRVDLAPHPVSGWIAVWLERGDDSGEIRIRSIDADGKPGDNLLVARTSPERGAGFPRLEAVGERVIVTWTETRSTEGGRAYPVGVRSAELEFPGESPPAPGRQP